MADKSTEIARIQKLLDSGATEAVVDGETVKIDHAALRARLRELRAEDTASNSPHPKLATHDLSNAF